eukprot:Plantae.Rhodophyta-Purpureofilum_apyrenoidigerum.ctg19836.p1 GENE.Plantae.Rhodophyta-Purpureofilum_apyrenoidigerum.ctg19836~~Plantae.Rhodophyta-Purpureofilum_apyrenoidigerum.ctg19836.p1  ORF type:complete len:357 (-),score=34.39 Plantae.Rhodophyta-Purpureofilum_apyrenoidigerum.ctg19836:236-1306(-)
MTPPWVSGVYAGPHRSAVWHLCSRILGALDYVFGVFTIGPWFCRDGLGDMSKLVTALRATPGEIDVCFEEKPSVHGKVTTCEGWFASSVAPLLPEESRRGFVLRVAPAHSAEPPKGVVVMMTCIGGETYDWRLRRHALPLAKEGYVSLLLMPPYYGKRRPAGQFRHLIRSIADWFACACGNWSDGISLVWWARRTYPGVPVGITGYSFGGGMAMNAALYDHDKPLAVVTAVGADGPHVMTSGIIRWQYDWRTLRRDLGDDAREKVYRIFSDYSLKREAERLKLPQKNKKLAIIAISAPHDAFIGEQNVENLCQFQRAYAGYFERRVVPGGHCTGFLTARVYLDAIKKSLCLVHRMS